MKRIALGLVFVAVYLVVTRVGAPPFRLLYDGFAPPLPYRWVSPPPELAKTNMPAQSGAGDVALDDKGSVSTSVPTADGQATLSLPPRSFGPTPGAKRVAVRIRPLDPARSGQPPPGLPYQGNAYRFTARYEPRGESAAPRRKVTVLIRYPVHTTAILQRTRLGWTKLSSRTISSTLQVYSDTRTLGTFVAAGGQRQLVLWWAVGAASGLAAVIGVLLGLRDRRRRGNA